MEKLIKWNEPAKRSDIAYDRKSCFTWLLSLVGKEQLAASNVDSETMNFIKGAACFHLLTIFKAMEILFTEHISLPLITDCFFIRCGNQENRIAAIEKYKNELCKAGGSIKKVVISDDVFEADTNVVNSSTQN